MYFCKKQQERDKVKLEECQKHGVKILYYTSQEVKVEEYKIIHSLDDLLNEIRKYD